MADKMQNPSLNNKRLELRRHEQLLTVRRLELRILELEDETVKVLEAIENTKKSIVETEKELAAAGIKF
jgi:hypothetical protein